MAGNGCGYLVTSVWLAQEQNAAASTGSTDFGG
jgi:hypothetical protein